MEFGRVDASNSQLTPACVSTGTHVLKFPLNALYINQVPQQLQGLDALEVDLFDVKDLIYCAFADIFDPQYLP